MADEITFRLAGPEDYQAVLDINDRATVEGLYTLQRFFILFQFHTNFFKKISIQTICDVLTAVNSHMDVHWNVNDFINHTK